MVSGFFFVCSPLRALVCACLPTASSAYSESSLSVRDWRACVRGYGTQAGPLNRRADRERQEEREVEREEERRTRSLLLVKGRSLLSCTPVCLSGDVVTGAEARSVRARS